MKALKVIGYYSRRSSGFEYEIEYSNTPVYAPGGDKNTAAPFFFL